MCVRLGRGTGCDKQLNNPVTKRESTQSVPYKQSKSHCNGDGIGCTIKTDFLFDPVSRFHSGVDMQTRWERVWQRKTVCEVSALNSFDALLLPQAIEEKSEEKEKVRKPDCRRR